MNKIIWAWVLCLLLSATGVLADPAAIYVARISSLIEPAKLATLGKRAANPRVQKYVAQLEEARLAGNNPTNVANEAVTKSGMTGAGAKLTSDAMLRNLTIADRLGCLDDEGLAEMRRGKAPTVKRGPYAGDQLSVDHIIPRAVVPELDNVIANLELMPLRMNESKNDKVGARQLALGKELNVARLLSKSGLTILQSAGK
jgi:hypothetical protein